MENNENLNNIENEAEELEAPAAEVELEEKVEEKMEENVEKKPSKKKTIITVVAFALGIILLAALFILFTDNSISKSIFTTTTTTQEKPSAPEYVPMDYSKEDLSKYITLGQYTGLKVETPLIELTDKELKDEIKAQIDELLLERATYEKLDKGVVREGVKFSFDYKGYLDGEPFEGGSNIDTIAYIENKVLYYQDGNGQWGRFIDGFDQILGHEVKTQFDIPVKFPEDYGNEQLNGKDVIFTITINYIYGEPKLPEYNDNWVSTLTGGEYKTVADFEKYLEESMVEGIKEKNLELTWNAIAKNVTVVEITDQMMFNNVYENIKGTIEYYASMYGMTYESLLSSGYLAMIAGVDLKSDEEVRLYVNEVLKEETLVEGVKEDVKLELCRYAIIQAEGLEATEEEFKEFVADLAKRANKTEDEVISILGEDTIKQEIVFNKLGELVVAENELVLKETEEKK